MPGNDLNITLPTVGVTEGPDYATQINAALTTLIDDVEAKITPDEIDINQDLTFASGASNYSAININTLGLVAQASVLSGSNPRRIFAFSGELYYQDASGNNVQITSGGGVNNASAGSINTTGSPAYGASGVEVLWSGSDLEYRFKDGSGANDLADLVFARAELGNGANRMTLAASVTTDYTVTFPATAPGANDSLFEIDTTGNISFVRDISIDTVTTTGDIEAGGHVEGERIYFTATEERFVNAFGMFDGSGGSGFSGTPTGAGVGSSIWSASSGFSGGSLVIDLGEMFLPNTDIIKVELYYGSSTAAGTWELEIASVQSSTGTYTSEDNDTWTPAATTLVGSQPQVQNWTLSSSLAILNDRTYFLRIVVPNVANTREVLHVIIDYQRPQP